MWYTRKMRIATLCMIVVTVVGGCARSRDARFYLLTAMAESRHADPADPGSNPVSLAVGPIEFPAYLNRPQIVTRSTDNRLRLADFDRWAEPLKQHFSRVLAENLATLLSTERILVLPWRGKTPIQYRVAMDVIRFDRATGGDVLLIARWAVFDSDGNEVALLRKSVVTASVRGEDFGELAAAMSRALNELSEQIAVVIQSLE